MREAGISKKIVPLSLHGIRAFVVGIIKEKKVCDSKYGIVKEIEFYRRRFSFTFRYPSWTIKNHDDWCAENEMYFAEICKERRKKSSKYL